MKTQYKRRLGDMLVDLGTITQEQLDEVLKKQKVSGKRLGELLIEEGLITENEMISLLEVQLGIPRVYPEFITVDEKAVKSISQSLANKYTLIPVAYEEDKIKVIMSDPLNIYAMEDIQIATGYEVESCIATYDEIKKMIDKCYSSQYMQKVTEELSKEQQQKFEQKEEKLEIDDVRNAPVVKLVDSIIDNAVKNGASDIHIEPFENYIKTRYRIDGELEEILRTPKETMAALVTRIKILAGLNIAEKRIPQDGRIITRVDGKPIDLRISVLPTVNGEKIVIRILKKDNFLIGRDKLGLPQEDMIKLENIMKSPHGIILITGPTGSGKSTSLYALLSDLNKPNINVITIEDPVEYTMEGINQVSVNVKAGLTFASGLRSILRQDPDIVMVGEIRDGETAEIAVRASITGHLVLSTLHTNDAPSTIFRLIDMGIEPFLVASSIEGIIAQRLVKKICPKCKQEYEATEHEKRLLNHPIDESLKLYRGVGCNQCNKTGYKGRTGIYEIMEISREIRQAIIKGTTVGELEELCAKNEMKTLRKYCIELVVNGTTTLDELIKVAFIKE